jgi:putative chitinase
MLNKAEFFKVVRTNLFVKGMSKLQVAGIEGIVDYYLSKYTDPENLAYILATAYHESAQTMQAVREFGRGAGYDYGKKLDMGSGPRKRVPYETPDQLYYGRGLVQITWLTNYRNIGRKLGIDLANNPDQALELPIAIKILVEGMVGGWFTGKKLDTFFAGPKADAVGARKIVNGSDKALLIASHYIKFLKALTYATK